ncbi:MAG: M14 family zinc carboxypeptidase, partial [Crocinitomicaceae bacterium]
MKHILSIIAVCFLNQVFAQFDGNTTPNYLELISIYKSLDEEHDEIELFQMGESDYGLPIYLCVLNGANDSIQTFKKAQEETTVFINNAIHPGEPDGVNACLIWINNWIEAGKNTKNLPVIGIIPAYNVGGMMNRSSSSRANQDGPEEYGFRGNAQNLDLNRDFIKMDSKNMFTFAKIYHALDPDVFIDTHVSNGADYQYTMTYIASVRERMSPMLGALMHDDLIPFLAQKSSEKGFDLIPYVDLRGETPEFGIQVFNDLPRYAMGYASLMNAISFTLETHMLKPFPERVESTEIFIDQTIEWTKNNKEKVELARMQTLEWERKMKCYPYNFKLSDVQTEIEFKG